MAAVTLTRPEPVNQPTAAPVSRPRRVPVRRRGDLVAPALALVLAASFGLRVWGIKQGLPYSYNVDEATHFVPRAVGFFGHDLNPHYFLNPPAYSYLLHAVLDLWFGGRDGVVRAYTQDPTAVFVLARLVAALLGTLSVWLTYLAGARLFGRAAGLVAAAIFGAAFLPVFYSHLALNDVPALAPIALSLVGVAGVLRRGRWADYAIAGLGVGLAAATKYTGGVTLVCLLGAYACDALRAQPRRATGRLAGALALALCGFLAGNPYALLDPSAFWNGVSSQASLAAGQDPAKLGTTEGSGITYYLWSYTWGLGWVPALAGLAGAALLVARRRIAMILVLLPAPVAFLVFMGVQQRYFGRWLMPTFPIVAILAGYATAALIGRLRVARRLPLVVAVPVAAVLLLGQSLVSVVHDDVVLSRADTRTALRDWMVANVPAGAKVVIEPVVPDDWGADVGRSLAFTPDGSRWQRFPVSLTDVDMAGRPLPAGQRRYVLVDQYERTLRPALIDEYLAHGYCWVVTGSLQAGRAYAQPRVVPQAIAYYHALSQRAERLYLGTPFRAGTRPVLFNFDWSIDYYAPQYERPGPEVSVYRLRGCR